MFLPASVLAVGEVFTRNLKMGDVGTDVKNLQIILNSNPSTIVATTGFGSPNNETLFFGDKTRLAVIKFQELYRSEILAPLGLTNGTGFVGTSTRQKLNSLAPNILNQNEDSSSGDGAATNEAIQAITSLGAPILAQIIQQYIQENVKDAVNLLQPFGGQIMEVFPCPCSNNTKLTVGPPKGGDFMLEASTIIYDYGNVSTPGVWVTGLYEPVGVCLIPSGDGCATVPNSGSIYMIGTSAY